MKCFSPGSPSNTSARCLRRALKCFDMTSFCSTTLTYIYYKSESYRCWTRPCQHQLHFPVWGRSPSPCGRNTENISQAYSRYDICARIHMSDFNPPCFLTHFWSEICFLKQKGGEKTLCNSVYSDTFYSRLFHYRRAAFSSQLKSKIDDILAKAAAIRIIFEYRRRTCTVKITHSPITLGNISFINLVSIFRVFQTSSPPWNPVYVRRVVVSTLAFNLSSHRHTSVSLLFTSRFIDLY
jgi:hypothetical protein